MVIHSEKYKKTSNMNQYPSTATIKDVKLSDIELPDGYSFIHDRDFTQIDDLVLHFFW
jgi:hypothetical protein